MTLLLAGCELWTETRLTSPIDMLVSTILPYFFVTILLRCQIIVNCLLASFLADNVVKRSCRVAL